MKVKIKKLHPDSIIPRYAKEGDAGLDLTAINIEKVAPDKLNYYTGLAVKIPEGHCGLLLPRSSIRNKDLVLSNSVGLIDSGFVGEIQVSFKTTRIVPEIYEVGDRIAQLLIIPYPQIEFEEVEELPKTERGEGGFGSSGN